MNSEVETKATEEVLEEYEKTYNERLKFLIKQEMRCKTNLKNSRKEIDEHLKLTLEDWIATYAPTVAVNDNFYIGSAIHR